MRNEQLGVSMLCTFMEAKLVTKVVPISCSRVKIVCVASSCGYKATITRRCDIRNVDFMKSVAKKASIAKLEAFFVSQGIENIRIGLTWDHLGRFRGRGVYLISDLDPHEQEIRRLTFTERRMLDEEMDGW